MPNKWTKVYKFLEKNVLWVVAVFLLYAVLFVLD